MFHKDRKYRVIFITSFSEKEETVTGDLIKGYLQALEHSRCSVLSIFLLPKE